MNNVNSSKNPISKLAYLFCMADAVWLTDSVQMTSTNLHSQVQIKGWLLNSKLRIPTEVDLTCAAAWRGSVEWTTQLTIRKAVFDQQQDELVIHDANRFDKRDWVCCGEQIINWTCLTDKDIEFGRAAAPTNVAVEMQIDRIGTS